MEPGASLLDEIDEFVAAGVPPRDALRMATAGAAEFLGQAGEFGVIAPGARADLLLLDGDPSVDLGALDAPAGIMLRGRWYRAPAAVTGPPGGVTPPAVVRPARASAGSAEPSL